jgi:hypothetical protein
MGSQFTPGPWHAANDGVIWHETIVEVSHPECCGDFRPNGECCGLSVQGSHQELAQEQIAHCAPEDADLIAAAPELYEALEIIWREWSLRCDPNAEFPEWPDDAMAVMNDAFKNDFPAKAKAAIAKVRGEA